MIATTGNTTVAIASALPTDPMNLVTSGHGQAIPTRSFRHGPSACPSSPEPTPTLPPKATCGTTTERPPCRPSPLKTNTTRPAGPRLRCTESRSTHTRRHPGAASPAQAHPARMAPQTTPRPRHLLLLPPLPARSPRSRTTSPWRRPPTASSRSTAKASRCSATTATRSGPTRSFPNTCRPSTNRWCASCWPRRRAKIPCQAMATSPTPQAPAPCATRTRSRPSSTRGGARR